MNTNHEQLAELVDWSNEGIAAGVVLTVPAGVTSDYVRAYNVHACPNTEPYNYKQTQYMACRGEGSIIERVYDLDPEKTFLFLLNPTRPAFIRKQIIEQQPLDAAAIDRVHNYVRRRLQDNAFEDPHDCNYRIYVFPAIGNIELKQKPRIKGGARNQRYIRLSALRRSQDFVETLIGY